MSLAFAAGQEITADMLNRILRREVTKASPEDVTSSTTLQTDDELTYSVEAGRTYAVVAHLAVTGAAAGDIKVDWTVTGGLAQVTPRACFGPGINTTDATATAAAANTVGVNRSSVHDLTTAVAYGLDGTATTAIREEFTVAATTTGVLTMRWAQNSSSATKTTVAAGSRLVLTPIG